MLPTGSGGQARELSCRAHLGWARAASRAASAPEMVTLQGAGGASCLPTRTHSRQVGAYLRRLRHPQGCQRVAGGGVPLRDATSGSETMHRPTPQGSQRLGGGADPHGDSPPGGFSAALGVGHAVGPGAVRPLRGRKALDPTPTGGLATPGYPLASLAGCRPRIAPRTCLVWLQGGSFAEPDKVRGSR